MNHDWNGKGTASCNACDLYRMKRSGSWAYSMSLRGPWSRDLPVCVPVERPPPDYFSPSIERVLGWRERPILVLDVETTGLEWTVDEVIEIGGAFGRITPREGGGFDTRIERTFQTLARPTSVLDPRITEITGITESALESAPTQEEAARGLLDFVRGMPEETLLATYNEAFDHPFLSGSLLTRNRLPVPAMLRHHAIRLDPYMWSRKIDRYVKGGHKLTIVAERHKLLDRVTGNAHRADYDAQLAFEVLAHFAAHVPDQLEDLYDWQRMSKAEWHTFLFGVIIPRDRREERARLAESEAVDVDPAEEC